MKTLNMKHLVGSVAVILMMILFSACAGVGSNSLTGSIVSVNASTHTVVVNVNGTQDTINNVPNNIIQALSGQVGKVYTLQVTANSDGTFSIVGGTNIVLDNSDGTPEVNDTPTTNETPTTVEPGTIEFFGSIISSTSSSVTISMPDGSQLALTLNNTKLDDFNGVVPSPGTKVKVEASANTDGNFNADKLSMVDTTDTTNQVTFTGVTTAAVGSDNIIHFTVGNKRYSFTIASSTDLGDFNNSVQQIAKGTSVKVEVQYNSATNVTVLKVSNASS